MADVSWLAWPFLTLYLLSLFVISLFCFLQFHLWIIYVTAPRKIQGNPNFAKQDLKEWPMVTIQVPVFNEKYVVERIIDAVMEIDYPKDRFEVQILDDSTDETLDLSRNKAQEFRVAGYNISVLHRTDRSGFKAGALQHGLKTAKGTLITIFDADFVPMPNFLKQLLHHFEDPHVGVVQTRWGHINENYSLLTRVQALQLNVHFTIEQFGRYLAGYFLQFNGTAGIWRKACIDDAGGWHADTLTEDLDLSYRAQLKGWKVIFREDVVTPAELPTDMHALKSQQYRWMKGGAETARKLLPSIYNTSLPIWKKVHALMHVLASSIFIFVFLLGISSVALAWLISDDAIFSQIPSAVFFPYPLVFICLIYLTANNNSLQKPLDRILQVGRFILLFPIFMAMSMAISFHNTIAVVQGFIGKRTSFVRTPKYGNSPAFIKKATSTSYFSGRLKPETAWEVLFFFLFSASAWHGIKDMYHDFVMLHLMLAIGYSIILFYTFKDYYVGHSGK